MIEGLIAGHLVGLAETRQGKNDSTFALAKVKATAGALTPKVWTDKQGNTRPALDMVATQVLTAYHAARKQQALGDAGDSSLSP